MNIFAFRPFKGKFNLGDSADIPENEDGTLIGAVKEVKASLTDKNVTYYNGKLYVLNADGTRGDEISMGMQKNYVFKVKTDSNSNGVCTVDISSLADTDTVCITATYGGSGWCKNYTVADMKSTWSAWTWVQTQVNIGPDFKCDSDKLYVRGHDGYMCDVIVTLP